MGGSDWSLANHFDPMGGGGKTNLEFQSDPQGPMYSCNPNTGASRWVGKIKLQ